jgi:EF hand
MTASSRNIRRLHFPVPVFLAGALLVSIAAVAADYPATFESLDKDGNGYISSQEAAARPELAKNWSTIDKNSDNQLDITEFSAFEGKGTFTPPEDSEEPGIGAAPY